MPNTKAGPLFDMATSELQEQLRNAHQELLNLRFHLATHQNTNYARIRVLKRDVARLKTILRERDLAESGA